MVVVAHHCDVLKPLILHLQNVFNGYKLFLNLKNHLHFYDPSEEDKKLSIL